MKGRWGSEEVMVVEEEGAVERRDVRGFISAPVSAGPGGSRGLRVLLPAGNTMSGRTLRPVTLRACRGTWFRCVSFRFGLSEDSEN